MSKKENQKESTEIANDSDESAVQQTEEISTQQVSPKKKKSRFKRIFLLMIIALLVGSAAYAYYQYHSKSTFETPFIVTTSNSEPQVIPVSDFNSTSTQNEEKVVELETSLFEETEQQEAPKTLPAPEEIPITVQPTETIPQMQVAPQTPPKAEPEPTKPSTLKTQQKLMPVLLDGMVIEVL